MKMVAQGDVREALPVGEYVARLANVKTLPASQLYPDSGPSYAWEFIVLDGPKKGSTGTAFTKTNLTAANNLGKLLRSMLGRVIVHGEEIDTDDFVGKNYRITVDFNQSGSSTRVMRATPLGGNQVAAQASAQVPPPPASSRPGMPATPPPPGQRTPVQTQADYKNQARWAFVTLGDDPEPKEMQVGSIRQLVINGMSSAEIMCYIPETKSWMTLAAVDMPF